MRRLRPKRSGSANPDRAGIDGSTKSASSDPPHGPRYKHPLKHPPDSSLICRVGFDNFRSKTHHFFSPYFHTDLPNGPYPNLSLKHQHTLIPKADTPESPAQPLAQRLFFSESSPRAVPAGPPRGVRLNEEPSYVIDGTSEEAQDWHGPTPQVCHKPILELDPEKVIEPGHSSAVWLLHGIHPLLPRPLKTPRASMRDAQTPYSIEPRPHVLLPYLVFEAERQTFHGSTQSRFHPHPLIFQIESPHS